MVYSQPSIIPKVKHSSVIVANLISEYDASKCVDQSFLFHFEYNRKNLRMDRTDSTCIAKYVNDSTPQHVNCRMVVKYEDTIPHLCLIATRKIMANVELRYDGEKKEMLPWKRNLQMLIPRNLLALKKEENCNPLPITTQNLPKSKLS